MPPKQKIIRVRENWPISEWALYEAAPHLTVYRVEQILSYDLEEGSNWQHFYDVLLVEDEEATLVRREEHRRVLQALKELTDTDRS